MTAINLQPAELYARLEQNQNKLFNLRSETVTNLQFLEIVKGDHGDYSLKDKFDSLQEKNVRLQQNEDSLQISKKVCAAIFAVGVLGVGAGIVGFALMSGIPDLLLLGVFGTAYGIGFMAMSAANYSIDKSAVDSQKQKITEDEKKLLEMAQAMGKFQVLNKNYGKVLRERSKDSKEHRDFAEANLAMDQLVEFQNIFQERATA